MTMMPSTHPDTMSASEQKKEDENEEHQYMLDEIVSNIQSKREIIYIEKPVYRPNEETVANKLPKAEQEVLANIVKPENYSGSAMLYDYNENFVYEVYTKVFYLTDIRLAPGEKIVGNPALSDTVRFKWEAGSNYGSDGLERQHMYIKPTAAGLEATLIINTNLRSYHLVLKSYNSTYMPIVSWHYPLSAEEQLSLKKSGMEKSFAGNTTESFGGDLPDFNFRVTYTVFRKPYWLPKLVYAFGGKTYIIMPKETFQRELPGVFGERRDLINYRVQGNTFIIDKLLDKITLRYNGKKAVIRRIK
jgi:P-type conjugative transfer protein trbG